MSIMTKKVVRRITTETVDDDGMRKTVVKEHAAKKTVRKSSHHKKKKMTAREREELLIENFVGLQHAMTNMSVKFGALSDNISKLLQIFEESAKNFVSGGRPDDAEMLTKIDSLLNQNKTIAKGLVLMEGKLRGRGEGGASMTPPPRMNNPMHPPAQQQATPAPSTPNFSNSVKPLPGI